DAPALLARKHICTAPAVVQVLLTRNQVGRLQLRSVLGRRNGPCAPAEENGAGIPHIGVEVGAAESPEIAGGEPAIAGAQLIAAVEIERDESVEQMRLHAQ